jgi:uncharacterized protein
MFVPGTYQQLQVEKITASGAYLASAAGEILLPRKYLPPGLQPGDTIEVFVYLDSADRPIATTRTPKARVGEFAVLTVTDTGRVGAFLDWGLEKDLLVPFSEQPQPMRKGERHVVRVYLDNSGRIAASAKIGKFLETEQIPLQVGEEVELLLYALTDLGAKVIINGRYGGLLFKNELHGRPRPGTRLKGYVRNLRADSKIDVTLKKGGSAEMAGSRERLLKALEAAGGFLPLGDKSPPERIGAVLKMSKKSFKKAVGNLYKEGFIELAADGIKLRSR